MPLDRATHVGHCAKGRDLVAEVGTHVLSERAALPEPQQLLTEARKHGRARGHKELDSGEWWSGKRLQDGMRTRAEQRGKW
jgi:hypothetical protein